MNYDRRGTRGCKSIRKELLERSVIESLSECLSPTEDLRNHLYEILRNRESNGETSGESHFAEDGIGNSLIWNCKNRREPRTEPRRVESIENWN